LLKRFPVENYSVPTDPQITGHRQGVSPFFSVIIPVYNRAESITAAIDSVLAQTCRDYELIVIDDGSTDTTPNLIASYGTIIRVVRQPNAGGGPARQRGIEQARGNYVAFLDSDDVWPPWTLATYRRVIHEANQPALLLGSAIHTHENPAQLNLTEESVAYFTEPDFLAAASDYHWFGFSIIAARRSCIPESGGFPSSRIAAQDLFFLLMLGDQPGFAVITSPRTAIYRRHIGNISGNPATLATAMRELIAREKQDHFPGGGSRSPARRKLLCRSARAASVSLLRAGMHRDAWDLYASTWQWQLKDARWKYLLGFAGSFVASSLLSIRTAARGPSRHIAKPTQTESTC